MQVDDDDWLRQKAREVAGAVLLIGEGYPDYVGCPEEMRGVVAHLLREGESLVFKGFEIRGEKVDDPPYFWMFRFEGKDSYIVVNIADDRFSVRPYYRSESMYKLEALIDHLRDSLGNYAVAARLGMRPGQSGEKPFPWLRR